MRLFELGRHRARAAMPPKDATGEVFGADANDKGGIVDHFDQPPLIAQLLEGRNGALLEDWLARRWAVHEKAAGK